MKNNCLTPWAHIKWRLWHVLSKGCRSLTAPRSKVIVSLPMVVYPCYICLSICDWWHQKKRVSGGGEAWLTTSDEMEPKEEEEAIISASLFLLLFPSHLSTCPVCHQSAPPPLAFRAPAPWTLWWRCL